MGRIGLFSLVYMALTTTLLVCQYYEYYNENKWATSYNCNHFSSPPPLNVMMVKYAVNMLFGVATGFWICSRKTFYSWMRFCEQSSSCVPAGIVTWLKERRMKCQHVDADAVCDLPTDILHDSKSNEHGHSLIMSQCSETSSRDDTITYTDQ